MKGKTRKKKVRRAYSYIRFSSAGQIDNDSVRRQTKATTEYCRQHNLILDDSLDLRDLAVSAHKGRNVTKGALGRFILACQSGTVERGSALILESLDRLSRQSPRRTISLLNQLLDLGIEIHVTGINKVFYPDSEDGMDLIIAVALAMRAFDESDAKSKRLKEVFAEKRKKAIAGEGHITKTLPWWLQWDTKREGFVCPPDREKVLRRIFEDVAGGMSPQAVARKLNEEKTPTWRFKGRKKDADGKPYGPPIPATVWLDNRIRMTILSDAPMGVIEATRKTRVAGRKWRLEDYYPAVIDPDLVANARKTIQENRRKLKGRKPTEEGVPNLLKAIVRYRDLWCRFSVRRPRSGGWNGYYEAVDHNRRMPWMIAANQLEPILLVSIAGLSPVNLKPPSTGNAETAILRAEVQALENTLSNIGMAVQAGSTSMIPRLVEVEKELAAAKEQLVAAEAADGVAIDLGAISQIAGYELAHLKDPEVRPEIAATLRRLVSRIQVGSDCHDLPHNSDGDIMTLEDGDTVLEDTRPDPTGSRGKHPLAIYIRFHGGGEMTIQRGTTRCVGYVQPNEILIHRIFRAGDEIVN